MGGMVKEESIPRLVLGVDDCRITRRLLPMYLREAGFEVVLAENGLDALEQLGREPCSVVVTDLNMPHMDGVEFARSVKENPFFQDIPVIILTTHGDEEERESVLEAGASVFLSKPITQEALIREVERVLPKECRRMEAPIL